MRACSAPFPVRFHANESNLGSTRNFEKAAALCSGDLIAFSDQDDVWLPHKLERLEAEFLLRPEVGLVFSDAEVVDENLQPLGFGLWEQLGFNKDLRRGVTTRGRALDVLLPGWTVTGATMAFRSKFRSLALTIPDDLPMIHDGWIALVVAAVSKVALIDEPLIKYRQHSGQQIGAPKTGPARSETGLKDLDGIRTALLRSNSYEELLKIGDRVRLRLMDRCSHPESVAALRRLDARLSHLRARARLPKSRLGRLGPVLRELLTMRYYRYSNGIFSAIKDLVS